LQLQLFARNAFARQPRESRALDLQPGRGVVAEPRDLERGVEVRDDLAERRD
jgi:hypothetical protein